MATESDYDVTGLRIHLNELTASLDHAIMEGDSFECVKNIYMKIKEIECRLRVLEWKAASGAKREQERRHNLRIINQRPLL